MPVLTVPPTGSPAQGEDPAGGSRRAGHLEIVTAWRRANGMRWIVLLAPLVAILITALAVVSAPPRRVGSATFITTTSDWPGDPSSVRQATEDFSALVGTEMFIRRVQAATGARADSLRDGLAVSRVGASNVVTVTYTGPDPQNVRHIATQAATAAHALLYAAALGEARGEVRVLTQARDAAQERLEEYLGSRGVWLPEEAHSLQSREVETLQDLLLRARVRDDFEVEAELEDLLVEAEDDLRGLADIVFRARVLAADVVRIDGQLSLAEQEEAALASLADRERADAVINPGPVAKVSPLPQAIERGVVAGVVAGALMVAIVVLVGARAVRQPAPARREEDLHETATARAAG